MLAESFTYKRIRHPEGRKASKLSRVPDRAPLLRVNGQSLRAGLICGIKENANAGEDDTANAGFKLLLLAIWRMQERQRTVQIRARA